MTEQTIPRTLETDAIPVRLLEPDDLDAIVAIDAEVSGRTRSRFYRLKLDQAMRESGLTTSLGVEQDGRLVGFLLARTYYGEFGLPEPVAVIDAIGVDPAYTGRKVGAAMIRQLSNNMRALGVETLRTEVGWNDLDLLGFLARQGFTPAPRLCLERGLGPGQ